MSIFTEPVAAKAILRNLPAPELRAMAKKDEIPNEFGIALYHTRVKSRSAAFTEIVYDPNAEQAQRIRKARDYLSQTELVCVDRNIGQNPANIFRARFYVTRDYARLAYMFTENFFPPSWDGEPELTVIGIPEWPERIIYVCPGHNVTYILGSDYYGEAKMAALRHAMHIMREQRDGLGLHAGSKIYRLFVDGKLVEKGVLIFGLSGTGKTTITVNGHGLKPPEGVEILQDDINMLTRDSSCYGTERNFYVKTDSLTQQPGLLKAATSPGAIAENVYVDEKGRIDFDNFSISTNGRCIVPRHLIPNAAASIDFPRTDVVFFITRRYDLPPAGRLISAAQAAAFLMLGESTITSADDPNRVGESKRVVAFDPFIVDKPHKNGNRFYEILKANPHIECYLLNTGEVGGVKIEPWVTLKIAEKILRGQVRWEYDPLLGYDVATEIEGIDMARFNPYKLYGRAEFERRMKRLKEERKEYLKQFPGLYTEIIAAIG